MGVPLVGKNIAGEYPSVYNPVSKHTSISPYRAALLALSPIRLYPMNEVSGVTGFDLGSQAQNGTYSNTSGTLVGVMLNQTGMVNNDSGGSVFFDGTGPGFLDCPTTSMPQGNAKWSMVVTFKTHVTNNVATIIGFGTHQVTKGVPRILVINLTVLYSAFNSDSGTTSISADTIYQLAATWDQTTIRFYVNGSQVSTVSPGTMAVGTDEARIAGLKSEVQNLTGFAQYGVWYDYDLSAGQISTLYSKM